jgi:hypothetical protein
MEGFEGKCPELTGVALARIMKPNTALHAKSKTLFANCKSSGRPCQHLKLENLHFTTRLWKTRQSRAFPLPRLSFHTYITSAKITPPSTILAETLSLSPDERVLEDVLTSEAWEV